MMLRLLSIMILVLMPVIAAPVPLAAESCRFVLGFQTMYELLPDIVGQCTENEQYSGRNGDASQHTTNGLLVWRKLDNFTAFTDGYRTWVNGPHGVAERLNTERFPWEDDPLPRDPNDPSVVTVQKAPNGSFLYLVNGSSEPFIGMGYNPIYRQLSNSERTVYYERDFRMLCEAGVNHILGWDTDKGYEQDKWDEITLDIAHRYGLGVVMPYYLPPDGDYDDQTFTDGLMEAAAAKIARFKDHPALRMWGVGNEVLSEMDARPMRASFGRFYLGLADLFHSLDPNHPVIYREAEDTFLAAIGQVLSDSPERSWLLYGTNVYSLRLGEILDAWPDYGLDRPLIVSEFGAEATWDASRAAGYLNMWRTIRAHSEYVLGGAPYVWTTEGPEPTDRKWGLMDAESRPVDETFENLAADWRTLSGGARQCP